MSVDFFDSSLGQETRQEAEFGICDDQKGEVAYTTTVNQASWIARVVNEQRKKATFTPLDHNLICYQPNTNNQESLCDGMLHVQGDSLFLVELKDKDKKAIPEAIAQLNHTIRLLKANHNLDQYRTKKAFVCNKRRPNFTVCRSVDQQKFADQGFRLDINTVVKVK